MLDVVEKLENSEEYKQFKKEYPGSYLCSAFFVIGKTPEEGKRQVNYALSETEVMSFDINSKWVIVPQKLETAKKQSVPEIARGEFKISIEEMETLIEKDAKKKFDKIIAVLQELNKELIWNITCMDGFTLHRYYINAKTGKLEKMKDIKLQDMMRIEKKTPDYIQ